MIQFGIKDMIDILLVAFMLYYMYKLHYCLPDCVDNILPDF